MSIGLLYDPLFLGHDTGPHPESPSRMAAIVALLRERGLWDGLPHLAVERAPLASLEAVHTMPYLAYLEELSAQGGGFLTPDTLMVADSFTVACLAAGAAERAATVVTQGEVEQAFAIVRPPGHHARPSAGMGFCLINNVAVAARAAQAAGARRVLIVDFDVHHGNGTQEIFEDDPDVLFFSSHQYPAYPGTGAMDELGTGAGRGATVNVPLPAGVGDAGYARVYQELLPPIARRFAPDIILASAGYDAHWTNSAHLSSIRMQVSVAGFGTITEQLRSLAAELCGGRLALVLEGGYDPEALALSIAASLDVLLGRRVEDPLGPPRQRVTEPSLDLLFDRVRRLHQLT